MQCLASLAGSYMLQSYRLKLGTTLSRANKTTQSLPQSHVGSIRVVVIFPEYRHCISGKGVGGTARKDDCSTCSNFNRKKLHGVPAYLSFKRITVCQKS